MLLLALATTALSAAVIRGTIVENRTGKPLSRAVVVLQPIAGTPGSPATMRTNNFGGFEFQSLAGGSYVLKATRRGFLPLEYGQKLWNSAGQPIVLTADGSAFLNLRLMRYGGITGTILDENDIGVTGRDVVAYRNTQQPQAGGAREERRSRNVPPFGAGARHLPGAYRRHAGRADLLRSDILEGGPANGRCAYRAGVPG